MCRALPLTLFLLQGDRGERGLVGAPGEQGRAVSTWGGTRGVGGGTVWGKAGAAALIAVG